MQHYDTGWVLCTVGRAHTELVDYTQAARVFEWAHTRDPTRLEVRLFTRTGRGIRGGVRGLLAACPTRNI